MKNIRLQLILIVLLVSSYGYGQSNFLIMKYYPTECGELSFYFDMCYTPMDSIRYDKYIVKGYAVDNNSSSMAKYDVSNREFEIIDSVMKDCRKIPGSRYAVDSSFYLEIITGYNGVEKNSYRVYGIIDCILFLDRVIQKLILINTDFNNVALGYLKELQETFIYDRLCKCDFP